MAGPVYNDIVTTYEYSVLPATVVHGPVADLRMRLVVVVPPRAPSGAERIDHLTPQGRLGMTIGEHYVTAKVVPLGRPLVLFLGVDVPVPRTVGETVGQHDHVGRSLDPTFRHLRLARGIDVTAQTQLLAEVSGGIAKTPVIVSKAKARARARSQHQIDALREGLVHVGVPLGILWIGRAVERGPVGPHFAKEPQRPKVVELGHLDAARVLLVILRVHCRGNAHLALVVDATDAQRLGLGLGQSRQEHARQDRDDGDHHQQLNQRECGVNAARGIRGN